MKLSYTMVNNINWAQLPALSTLRAFEATARLRGFAPAARSLNVTTAAVAQQVRKLESELGETLVRREGRAVVLTDEGRQLAAPLHDAFATIASGVDEFKLRASSRGVRVSTTDYFVDSVVLPKLGEFWKRNPAMQVSFSPEGNLKPVDLENFDIAIRGAGPAKVWEGWDHIALVETPMIIAGAPSLIGSGSVDLCSLPWIQDRTIGGTVQRQMIEYAGCDPDTIKYVDPGDPKYEGEAALNGLGVATGPQLTMRKVLSDGSLILLHTVREMEGVYYAVFRKGPQPEAVRILLDWLVSICADFSSDQSA